MIMVYVSVGGYGVDCCGGGFGDELRALSALGSEQLLFGLVW